MQPERKCDLTWLAPFKSCSLFRRNAKLTSACLYQIMSITFTPDRLQVKSYLAGRAVCSRLTIAKGSKACSGGTMTWPWRPWICRASEYGAGPPGTACLDSARWCAGARQGPAPGLGQDLYADLPGDGISKPELLQPRIQVRHAAIADLLPQGQPPIDLGDHYFRQTPYHHRRQESEETPRSTVHGLSQGYNRFEQTGHVPNMAFVN